MNENTIGNCKFKQCNQKPGHDEGPYGTPHGMSVQPGLIFAPYGGGEGGFVDVDDCQPSDFKCDCCNSSMRARHYKNNGGELTCTSCQQIWNFSNDSMTSSIIASLYPSNMKETDPLFREYVKYQLKKHVFMTQAQYFFKLISNDECLKRINKSYRDVDEWKAAHPIRVSWWKQRINYLKRIFE